MSSAAPPPPSTSKRSRWKIWLGLVIMTVAALIVWQYPAWKAQAETGSAYAARMACSCRYVQGRPLDSCLTDFEPGTEIVSVEDLAEERRIRASVPLLASRTARYAGASGCMLEAE